VQVRQGVFAARRTQRVAMNLVLIGYRGTGKSSVARLLALRLAREWVDADAEIELRAGRSIATIFDEQGEEGFRKLEAEVLGDLLTGSSPAEGRIIAAGGGVVLRAENRELLTRSASCVWLRATPETIARRIAADESTASRRPALTALGRQEGIVRLLAARTPLYEACATLSIDTEGKSAEDVADEIIARLQLVPASTERA
jgi:shikimate kinase